MIAAAKLYWLWVVVSLLSFALGWMGADALDFYRRKRGSGRASTAAEPAGAIPPRHIRRQRGRMIAARVARAYAADRDRLN